MKKLFLLVGIVVVFASSQTASAARDVRPVVYFSMPPDFMEQVCKKKVWEGIITQWGGVGDARPTPFIGKQVSKGGQQIPVVSDPRLVVVVNDALKALFTECGMGLVGEGTPAHLKLAAEIRSFDVNVMRNTVTSNSASESMLRFYAQDGNGSRIIDVGVELEAKSRRGGNLKVLKKTANKLLLETLKEIPENDHMKELGRKKS